jgi:hypothetical protein
LQRRDRGTKVGADGGKGRGDDLRIQRHHEGGQRTPSVQFFPPLTSDSAIAFLRRVCGRVMRRVMVKTNAKRRGIRPKSFFRDRILSLVSNVFWPKGDEQASRIAMEGMMKRTLIRYRTKPELADKNAELIAGVFEELKVAKSRGVRYLSLRLDDDTFVHFVEAESDSANTLTGLAAFKAFQSGVRERCIEPPLARSVTIVGNYRMLNEP